MKSVLVTMGLLATLVLGACNTAPKSDEGKSDIREKAQATLNTAQVNDPSLKTVLDAAKGYAVFPTVGKGAVGVGGAYGKGVLYEGGVQVGYCDLTQASIGLQLGGQGYSEIIAFNSPDALNRFKTGKMELGAQATAVALKSGAGANAKYNDGVAVFTMGEKGLMFEAAVAGQKFNYEPNK